MNTISRGRKVGRSVRSAGSRLVSGTCYAGASACNVTLRCLGVAYNEVTPFARRAMGASFALLCMLAFSSVAMATDPLLPDTGIDIAAMVTEVVTTLGTIVAVIVAAFFAFLLIRKALRWARSGF